MLARYNAWANRLIFDAVAGAARGRGDQAAQEPVQEHGSHAEPQLRHRPHLPGAPRGTRRTATTARNTPDHPPLAELWRAQQEIDAWYIAWSDALTDAALAETVHFTFVGGGEGAMTRGEILLHIVNHTSYHRGFVAEMFYEVPAPPADHRLAGVPEGRARENDGARRRRALGLGRCAGRRSSRTARCSTWPAGAAVMRGFFLQQELESRRRGPRATGHSRRAFRTGGPGGRQPLAASGRALRGHRRDELPAPAAVSRCSRSRSRRAAC